MLITLIMKAVTTYLRRNFYISKAQQRKSTLSKTHQLVSISIVSLNEVKPIQRYSQNK